MLFLMTLKLWQTDTASVLQEASGYIKFLHKQLEVNSSCSQSPLFSLMKTVILPSI